MPLSQFPTARGVTVAADGMQESAVPDSCDEWSAFLDSGVGSESRATIRHLRQTVADLVRCAQSDLLPLQKLELLCTHLGTAEHWLAQIEAERDTRELAGPHFAPDVPVRVVRD